MVETETTLHCSVWERLLEASLYYFLLFSEQPLTPAIEKLNQERIKASQEEELGADGKEAF